ncbi:hypothetical protein [Crateriforma spongiae]|uniref:hypothetical protein n=1 Tax=Crateriforma spongiae TaxID=2724528 RepID=UPI001447C92C|nr:hypothetical protein [Crateriforma spongiae]
MPPIPHGMRVRLLTAIRVQSRKHGETESASRLSVLNRRGTFMEFSSLYVSVSGEFYKDLVTTDAFSFSDPDWIQK